MRLLLSVFFLVCSGFAADGLAPVVHVNNFGVVNKHLLRGAEPSPVGLAELGTAGVTVVIDLREAGAGTEFEKNQVEKLGMKYTNIPLPPLSSPTPDQMRTVLTLLAKDTSSTVFLHCRRGKDRTGTVIACYRIQHDGWDNEKALEEAKTYGMSFAERGMRSFILHFTPVATIADPLLITH